MQPTYADVLSSASGFACFVRNGTDNADQAAQMLRWDNRQVTPYRPVSPPQE
jgi:hypothetical protein